MYDFSVDYNAVDISKHDMAWYKIMLGFIKKMFTGLLSAWTTGWLDKWLASNSRGYFKFENIFLAIQFYNENNVTRSQ